MRIFSRNGGPGWLSAALLALSSTASAEYLLQSTSLDQCGGTAAGSAGFTANLFNVVFTPGNRTLSYDINAISSIAGKVTAEVNVIAYGLLAINQTIDPCDPKNKGFATLCPLNPGSIPLNSNSQLGPDLVNRIPGIAYTVPDLDATVRIRIKRQSDAVEIACVEAHLSNGQTVDQTGVQWTTAIIAGLGLLASAVTSGLGHSNTAAHVAANALSLFGLFQSQAIIGMTAVDMPPIVQSWTQDFQWTMGIIEIDFMQTVCTWYQRATGGTPSTIIANLQVQSVQIYRRSLESVQLIGRAVEDIVARGGYTMPKMLSRRDDSTTNTNQPVVSGITRVGFRAGIEPTNIFLTGLGFFVAFIVAVALAIVAFKGFCELATKRGWFKGDKFQDFRTGWKVVLKGILFRIILIGYTQMAVLCLWELTVRDSAAEVVLAIFYFLAMSAALFWAALKVIRIAKRSVSLHKNPAYILYSDPTALNKWGFLYVQYRATAYYFIFPQLAYILIKALFVALGQGAPVAQSVGLLIVEAIWLITVSIMRPWMDKKTNSFNIAIAAVNFINTIFLLIFTDVFNQPGLVSGLCGIIFVLLNAVFALVLLIMVLISSIYAIVSKNPDTRYQPMRDDRGSFIKSHSNLNTELDALAITARGEKRNIDDDSDSFMSGMAEKHPNASQVPLPPSNLGSSQHVNTYGQPPASPITASTPFMPAANRSRHGTPDNSGRQIYTSDGFARTATASPSRHNNGGYNSNGGGYGYDRSQSLRSETSYRPAGNAGGSQWQRGAGYDH